MNPVTAAERAIEALLRRDRLVAIAALAIAALLAWSFILTGAGLDPDIPMDMPGMDMPEKDTSVSGAAYFALMFPMWWMMMVAMMLPSAAPMILLFLAISRKQREQGSPFAPTGLFTLGYLLVWGGFSVAATMSQWALNDTDMIQQTMAIADPFISAGLLLGAGLWQLTPIKHACLQHCRAPVFFLTSHWRGERSGALRMGMTHGAFCLGCCWLLMGLLFAGGIMNPYWIIGIAAYVLLEKIMPYGQMLARASGVMLIGGSLWLVFAGL